MSVTKRLTISRDSSDSDVLSAVKEWVEDHVPKAWRDAAPAGRAAIRKVRPIAVTMTNRSSKLPDVPTTAEAGYPKLLAPVVPQAAAVRTGE